MGNGYYAIYAADSGKCLDIEGSSTANGADLHQWDCHWGDNQQFKFEDAGDGYYYIKAKHSNKCVDVSGVSQNEGAQIHQWDCLGADNQKWQINGLCGNSDFSEGSLLSTSTYPWHPVSRKVMDEWNTEPALCAYGGKMNGPLASFTVTSADVNKKITVASDALSSYVRNICVRLQRAPNSSGPAPGLK
jgi:hypothetical protein